MARHPSHILLYLHRRHQAKAGYHLHSRECLHGYPAAIQSSVILYCQGFDVLDRVFGLDRHINFDVECVKKGHKCL